jgi:hypothetical protein
MSTFRITPAEFLRELGWEFKKRDVWLTVKICPFCDGGASRDLNSFSVHETDGNYFCHRQKCSVGGSFWKLVESQGRNPREYLGERKDGFVKRRKKKFIYGR